MIVAVIAVRMVQVSVDQVVDMIAVWHGFVPAPGCMRVIGSALGRRGVAVWMAGVNGDHVVIDVVAVRVVEVAFVEVVDVIVVAHSDMATAFAVDVSMVAFVNGVGHVAEPTPQCPQPASASRPHRFPRRLA